MEFDDIVKIVDQVKGLEARLAVAEAERDNWKAAAKRLEDAVLKAGCAVDSLAFYEDCIVTPIARELRAERDAAQAGEARAVEALEAEQRAAHWRNLARITDKHEDHIEATRLSEIAQRLRHGIVLVLDRNISALDWLAQQRAEAAAEENDRWADDWWGRKGDCTASDFTARAAALRAGEVGGTDA